MKKYLFLFLFILPILVEAKPITKKEVVVAQEEWAKSIVEIGKMYISGGDYKGEALKTVNTLYAYDDGGVLFKLMKASEYQFRNTKEEALSYFIGGKKVEDDGFAIHPWSKVTFEGRDRMILLEGDFAVAMGNYSFKDPKTKEEIKAEYTFGYKRAEKDGRLVIFLHHSSLPYEK